MPTAQFRELFIQWTLPESYGTTTKSSSRSGDHQWRAALPSTAPIIMRRRTTALSQLLKSKPKTSIWSPKKMKITRKPDLDKSGKLEADIGVKVFDVMPERGDDDKGGKGVSQLLAEIEMPDSMIERSTVALLGFQVMEEELEAKEREMEWKMSESLALKTAMEELRRKKREELVGKKAASGWWKTKWALPVVALAACAGIVAAVVLAGKVKADNRRNRPNKIKTL